MKRNKQPAVLINHPGAAKELHLLHEVQQAKEILVVCREKLRIDAMFTSLPAGSRISFLSPPKGLLQLSEIPDYKADLVIAVGGGKVIDLAKGIIHQNSLQAYFIAIPTTAGSGSEATPFAVWYEDQKKISLEGPDLLPDLSILDAELLRNLPPLQRAISGADAYAQAIESLWNRNRNSSSATYAFEACKVLITDLPDFCREVNIQRDEAILLAAHNAGRAIAITRTTGPHALSYYLTARHGVPHGQAVAIFLPLFFLYNEEFVNRDSKLLQVLGVANAEEGFYRSLHLFREAGLATNFKELGLDSIDIDGLLQSVNQQRFENNPVAFEPAKLKMLIKEYL